MARQRKKSAEKTLSLRLKEMAAKAKRKELAREALGEYMATDPFALEELFRRNRREANWNPPKKKRA